MKTTTQFLTWAKAWYLLTLLLLAAPTALWAQAPAWQWATQSSRNAYNVNLRQTATASNGDVLVSGSFSGASATFGTLPAVSRVVGSPLNRTSFVGRLNGQTGQWIWIWAFVGNIDRPTAIIGTTDGGLTIAGEYYTTVSFGSTVLNSTGNHDLYVAHCDANGQWQWATTASLNGTLNAALDLAPNSEVVVAGSFSGTVTLGALPPLLAASNPMNLPAAFFVARLNGQTGQWQWAVQAPISNGGWACGVNDIARASNGDIALTGLLDGSVQFGSLPPLVSIGAYSLFVMRVNGMTGQWQWASQANKGQGLALALTRAGNVIVAADASGPVSLGSLPPLSGAGGRLLMASLNGNTGQWQWASQTGGTTIHTGPNALAITATDDIILAGNVYDTLRLGNLPRLLSNGQAAFVAKMAAQGGLWQWGKLAGPTQRVSTLSPWYSGAYTLSLTANDEPIVGGFLRGFTSFGSSVTLLGGTAPTDGGSDMFIAKLAATPLASHAYAGSSQFQLYPNPAITSFTVRLPGANAVSATALLVNGLGQIVRRQSLPAHIQELVMDVRGLAPGLYCLRLPLDSELITRIVTVQ